MAIPEWEKCLWDELGPLPDAERFIAYGSTIIYITRELLPRLGELRRDLILTMLDEPGADATRVAEMTGSRRIAIQRLANEARARIREQQRGAAA